MKRMTRRLLTVLLCLALLAAAGCQAAAPAPASSAAASVAEASVGHYTFRPKVRSVYMEEVFGKTLCETWDNLVDAMMAGETTFACPDNDTYDWVMGQFPNLCFPVVKDLIAPAMDRNNAVTDGVATFRYTVSREEFEQKVNAFAATVEDILNQVLRDDDSDFEKAFALYSYFAETYTYDQAMADFGGTDRSDLLSVTRVFEEKQGICSELSTAYSYLLMQAGVDATVMMGDRTFDNAAHQWSYIRLKGKDYHVDPTYVLGNHSLAFFLMDDVQRENEDYAPDTYVPTSCYAQEHPVLYRATDTTFSELWNAEFVRLDREAKILRCQAFSRDTGLYFDLDFSYGEM